VTLTGDLWMIGGVDFTAGFSYSDVWSTTDGVTWNQATANAAWPWRYFFSAASFNGQMWVMGGTGASGDLNDVWASPDGATWTDITPTAEFPARDSHSSTVYNGRLWVVAGTYTNVTTPVDLNDVWSSSDGAHWAEATASAAFSPRQSASLLAFNNALFLIGGIDGGGASSSEVWTSTDGATWTLVTANPGFEARGGAGAAVLNGRMWIYAGFDTLTGNDLNDCWSSADGLNWIEATSAAGFSLRAIPGSAAYSGSLWLVGGLDPLNNALPDVWRSP
jgi:hypothetical protein